MNMNTRFQSSVDTLFDKLKDKDQLTQLGQLYQWIKQDHITSMQFKFLIKMVMK